MALLFPLRRALPARRLTAPGARGALSTDCWSHHYPICVRRLRPDDALISMASCHGMEDRDWYAIGLITLREPRTDFQEVARLPARVMAGRFGARLHWGSWFPLGGLEVERGYPGLAEFRAVCEAHDPEGVFRNAFVGRVPFG